MIVWLSHQSRLPAGLSLPQYTDKIAHALEYAILSFLLVVAVRPRRATQLIVLGVLIFLFAASDEFHQSYVPGRVASLSDLAADLFGTVLVLLSSFAFVRRRDRDSL